MKFQTLLIIYIKTTCTSSDHDLNICKFQNSRHGTVGGVEHTRYLVSIHFDQENGYVHFMEKVMK